MARKKNNNNNSNAAFSGSKTGRKLRQAGESMKVVKLQDAIKLVERQDQGGVLMGMVGKLAGPVVSGLAKIMGVGDYTVEANSLGTSFGNGGAASASVPDFKGLNSNRIRHKECLGVVRSQGTTAFGVLGKYRFQPADKATFPWMSSFASNFTGYKVHGAVVVFETNTSEYSATPYLGTVCIATRYDTREPDFASMVEMQNCKFSVSAKPSQHILHPIECKDDFQNFNTWMTRRGVETDITYGYDKCNIYIAAEGLAGAATVIGRLWIAYDIELINPVAVSPGSDFSFARGSRFSSVQTGSTAPITHFAANRAFDTSFNTLANGSASDLQSLSAVTTTNIPYVAVDPDTSSLRIYKRCIVTYSYSALGSSLPTTQVCTVANTAGAGSYANRTATYQLATMTQDTYVVYANFTGPPSPTEYVTVNCPLLNGGTITNTSVQVVIEY